MPSNSNNASLSLVASDQKSGVPQVPYMEARVFRSSFTYSFPVSPGWKFIRLYFYPTRYGSEFDAVNSFLTVTVNNGFTLLKNFSADLTVKASKTKTASIIKEFIVPVYQTLNLTFTPSLNSLAFVNGIEIVSMPDRFYSKGGFDDVITNVGATFNFEINNLTAFETVYRLNVGGQMVDEVGDSGMFRRWLPDDESLLGVPGAIVRAPGIKINYMGKTPAYVAPEDVYATSRSMGNPDNPNINLNFNLTWLFTVDAGFGYLVRLHFCETFKFSVTDINQRIFSIFIENQLATNAMDVFRLSGGSWIPMYQDYYVYLSSESGARHDLQLVLRPVQDAMYNEAILNGVEILKLNNSNGNLAGPNSDPILSPDLKPNPILSRVGKGNKSHVLVIILIPVGSTIVLATFIVVLVLSMRQIKKKKKKKKENSIVAFKVQLKQYTYTELKKITKSFSHTVGKGGFGTVYGGNLCNGRKVAVKVLKDSNGNGEDFINEVASMSQTSHVNIVSLLGFCYEGSKRAIVSEFLENGSLDQFAFRNKALTQDVTTLYGITLGIARGLEYLHYGCKTRIVHFDKHGEQTWIFGDEITKAEKVMAKKMVVIGLWCIQPCPSNRPPMNRVVEMMEGSLDALEVPPKPSMHISTEIIPESSSLSDLGEDE